MQFLQLTAVYFIKIKIFVFIIISLFTFTAVLIRWRNELKRRKAIYSNLIAFDFSCDAHEATEKLAEIITNIFLPFLTFYLYTIYFTPKTLFSRIEPPQKWITVSTKNPPHNPSASSLPFSFTRRHRGLHLGHEGQPPPGFRFRTVEGPSRHPLDREEE